MPVAGVPDAHAARVSFIGVSKSFQSVRAQRTVALAPISFSIEPGQFVCFVGPSGCGKTTLLRLTAGLLKPSGGSVDLNGYSGTFGYVSQEPILYPWRTVLQNAALGLEAVGEMARPRVAGLKQHLQAYGLGDFLNHLPHELSGGMKQRVAVVRALAHKPGLLLCDEPFSQIDFVNRLRLTAQFRFACRVLKSTVMLVTHNIEEAIFLGDRVLVLSGRPGALVADHRIELGVPKTDPVEVRRDPEFQHLFKLIWSQLG